ncbi:MAG: metallophosphoesterase [Magnetococcales bacterium]|nr:metallophosphoesterase [Magnetococcales bacterium]
MSQSQHQRRRPFLKQPLFWLLILVALAVSLWRTGLQNAANLQARSIEWRVVGWPVDETRVAIFSDWHLGTGPTMPRSVEAIRRHTVQGFAPHLIFMLGDFIDESLGHSDVEPDTIYQVFRRFQAPLGTYVVLGNHEHWYGKKRILPVLKMAGMTLLNNESRMLPLGSGTIALAGVVDHMTDTPDTKRALAGVLPTIPTLMLSHDPAVFRDLPDRGRILMVAGHTHGGQVVLPGLGILWMPTPIPKAWAHGWVQKGRNAMYVTSGVGVSLLPVRFGVLPEVVWLTVRPA